jgi:hypothetical protein
VLCRILGVKSRIQEQENDGGIRAPEEWFRQEFCANARADVSTPVEGVHEWPIARKNERWPLR